MFRPRIIALLLVLFTLLAYLPALQNGFVNYDDETYVVKNPMVLGGLTWAGVQWAFTTFHFSNWHPLTWIAYQTNCQLFRLNPAGHHLISLLFHAANTLLLFALMRRLTGGLWAGAFIAALFAWHPLHVESVAWVSELKDVLSIFFGLLALLAYARYAQTQKAAGSGSVAVAARVVPGGDFFPRSRFYWLAVVFFALSLMSKSMLVTLPFVLLLLDYWPFQRRTRPSFRGIIQGLGEKWPFLVMTAVVCVLTVLAQRDEAMSSLARVSLGLRLENTLTAYVGYLLKAIWPVHLAVFYPLPKAIPWPEVALAALVLLAITAVVVIAARRQPWLLVGWLWYLGTLVPVIGLVQVGDQAMADRYTYFPLIGIFLGLTLAAREFALRFRLPNVLLAVPAIIILIACVGLTESQLRHWRNSEALFTHALAVTPDNALVHLNLGVTFQGQHREAEALEEYRKAISLSPGRHEAYINIASILNDEGKPEEALEYCRVAVQLKPKSASAHHSLGIILVGLGRFDEARQEFSEAIRLDAAHASARFQMGLAWVKQGNDLQGVPHFREALRLDPQNFQMLLHVARVLAASENAQARNGSDAVVFARRAAELAGGNQPVVLDTLAMACAETGQFDEARQCQQQAVLLARQAGQKEDASLMQQRLELYQTNQPWRESFRGN